MNARWFDSIRSWIDEIGTPDSTGDWLAPLNRLAARLDVRNDAGQPIRFVDAARIQPENYELHIARNGSVPTRLDRAAAWHDYFNALAWLSFPRIKACLNRLQTEVIMQQQLVTQPQVVTQPQLDAVHSARPGAPGRGPLRDAITLFDENAALFVTRDAGIARNLRDGRWQQLFIGDRARFASDARILLFGHALLHKLITPYKAICAHAWIVIVSDAQWRQMRDGDQPAIAAIDAMVAAQLKAESIAGTLTPRSLTPLPVLGIPGWWPPNDEPAFYNDAAVFRPPRTGAPRAGRRSVGPLAAHEARRSMS